MIRIFALATALLINLPALAYYSVMDTGEVMPSRQYKLTPELQFITSQGGANIGTHFDIGLTEESALRGEINFGYIDFVGALYFKFVPYPDAEGQPLLGFNAGLVYAKYDGDTEYTVRFEPIVSKKFEFDWGALTPYASLPIGIQHRNQLRYDHDRNNLAAQLALGSQVDLKSLNNIGLMMELGFDLNHAAGYVSFGGVWYFGDKK